jgi:hypothetical protein
MLRGGAEELQKNEKTVKEIIEKIHKLKFPNILFDRFEIMEVRIKKE